MASLKFRLMALRLLAFYAACFVDLHVCQTVLLPLPYVESAS